MKYYYGFFKDVKGELFKVVIESYNDENESDIFVQPELVLSDSPFTVSYAGDDVIYKPYKCSTATVAIYNKEFNPDLNSQTGLDVKVKLLKAKNKYDDYYNLETSDLRLREADDTSFTVIWKGYSTPNAYSQGYNSYTDLFELECQDILSATRYMKAEVDLDSLDITFAEFLGSTICNRSRGVFKEYYVSKNIRLPIKGQEMLAADSIFNQIRFNKELLTDYEEEEEKYSILNIIEKYCKMLNLTAVQDADTLYFLSYEAIAQDYNTYSNYVPASLSFHNKNKKNEVVLGIEESSDEKVCIIAADDTNISLHGIYSDYIVTTDYLSVDYSSIDLNDEVNRTAWTNMDSEMTQVIESPLYGPSERHELAYNVLFTNSATSEEVAEDLRQGNRVRYQQFTMFGINEKAVRNMDVKFHCYNADVVTTTTITTPPEESGGISDPDIEEPPSTTVVQTWAAGSEINSYNAGDCNLQLANSKIVATPMGYYTSGSISNAPEYRFGYMMFHKGFLEYGVTDPSTLDQFYQDNKYVEQAMIDFTYTNVPLSKDNCILINGNVTWFNRIMPGDDVLDVEGLNYNTRLFLTASVKISASNQTSLYYNNGTWSSSLSRFKLTLEDSSDSAFNTDFSIKNTVQPPIHKLPTGTKGWCIPCPDNLSVNNYTVTITIYRSWGCGFRLATRSTFLSNWEVSFPVSDESNTYLTENAETRYRQKLSDIDSVVSETFNMHTYDGKNSHYSALLYTKTPHWLFYLPSNIDKKYLGHIHNLCLGDAMIAEELKIKTYVNQYCKPCMMLNVKVHADKMPFYSKFIYRRPTLEDKVYVIDTMDIDYKYNIYNLILYEKK